MEQIRFLKNFIITTTQTKMVDGKLQTVKNSYQINFGDIYKVKSVSKVGDDKYRIDFGKDISKIKGVASRVESSYLSVRNTQSATTKPTNVKSGGCGNCGKK